MGSIYRLKGLRPNTEPWGTPQVLLANEELNTPFLKALLKMQGLSKVQFCNGLIFFIFFSPAGTQCSFEFQ